MPTEIPEEHQIKYKIVEGGSVYQLEVAVRNEIKNGWRPFGGVAVDGGYRPPSFFQAMVKVKHPRLEFGVI